MDATYYSMAEARELFGDESGPWCICGRASQEDPWDLIEDGFRTFAAALDWFEVPERPIFVGEAYIDREQNEGVAFCFVDCDGTGDYRVQFS
jgi:hypothetical protein